MQHFYTYRLKEGHLSCLFCNNEVNAKVEIESFFKGIILRVLIFIAQVVQCPNWSVM